MGPAVEVFGFERVFFLGSPPSTVSRAQLNAGDWDKIIVINLRLYVRHLRIGALMLCFEAKHNVSMRLGRNGRA